MRARALQHRVARALGPAARLPLPDDLGDLPDDFFALAEHEQVDVVGQRFRVERGVATGGDERMLRSPVFAAHRHAGEIDHVEDVRVDELGREVEGDQVELARSNVVVDREQGDPVGAQLGLEVDPGRVGPLGHRIVALVEDLVEDLEALVGQADLVGVRVRQQPRDLPGSVLRVDRAVLAADVPSRFLHPHQEWFQPRPQRQWPQRRHGGRESTEPRAPRTGRRTRVRRPVSAPSQRIRRMCTFCTRPIMASVAIVDDPP